MLRNEMIFVAAVTHKNDTHTQPSFRLANAMFPIVAFWNKVRATVSEMLTGLQKTSAYATEKVFD